MLSSQKRTRVLKKGRAGESIRADPNVDRARPAHLSNVVFRGPGVIMAAYDFSHSPVGMPVIGRAARPVPSPPCSTVAVATHDVTGERSDYTDQDRFTPPPTARGWMIGPS